MELKKKYKEKELKNIIMFLDSYTHNEVDKYCMVLAIVEDLMKQFTKANHTKFGFSGVTFISTGKSFEYLLSLGFASDLKVTGDIGNSPYLFKDNKVYVDSSVYDYRDAESLKKATQSYQEIKVYGLMMKMINYVNRNYTGVLSVLDLAKHGYGGGTKKLVISLYDYETDFGCIDKPNMYIKGGEANNAYASQRGNVDVNLEKMHLEMLKPIATPSNSISSRIKL